MNATAQPNGGSTTDAPGSPSRLRGLVRGACLLAAASALAPWSVRLSAAWYVSALSPLVAAGSLLATHTFHAAAALGLLVGAIALLRRRWFCRWVCPTGLCADGASRCGTRLGRRCPRIAPLGQSIAVLTLAGAAFGYPLFLWLDPLAMFSGVFNLGSRSAGPASWWCAVGLPAVLLISVLLPGGWCACICPLGALQDLLSHVASAVRRRFLPARQRGNSRPHGRLARRLLLAASLGACWAAATRTLRRTASAPLRPPGAIAEWNFPGACIRCGNCVRACPVGIIGADLGQHGMAGLLAPVLRFEQDYCHEDCTRCMDLCSSGALRQLSAEAKRGTPIGYPRVDMGRCLLGDDHECARCRNSCPFEAITLVFSPTDYALTPRIDPAKCSGCGACEVACPTSPAKAIVVQPR